jgi:hypothetical protein
MLIPDLSSAVPVAVGAAAVSFSTALVAGSFYELAANTACWVARAQAVTFPAAEFVADAATDRLLFASAHGLTTGDGPFRATNTGGGLPAGIGAGTDYWAIVMDADEVKLATSYANALAGTAVDVTTAGTGTHSLAAAANAIKAGGGATAGSANGSKFVPAATVCTIAGATGYRVSVVRDAADGKASLTTLAVV